MGKKWKRLLVQARKDRAAAIASTPTEAPVEETIVVEKAPIAQPKKVEAPAPVVAKPAKRSKSTKKISKVSKKD